MGNNCIWHSKNLFIVYAGLTAAGYDLAKTPTNFNEIIDYIKNNNFNPDDIGMDTVEWLQQLPVYYLKVVNTDGFECLWEHYLNTAKKDDTDIQAIQDDALTNITVLLEVPKKELPKIILIPNRLQAPQCANYIKKDGIIYIIKAIPDVESIVHEYLHSILEKYLLVSKSIIVEYLYLLEPVLDEMIRYKYAWKFDAGSWSKVFEENLVRAMTLWVCFLDNKEEAFNRAYVEEKSGFIYVPVILESLLNEWNRLDSFSLFIEQCLSRSKGKGDKGDGKGDSGFIE